MGADRGYNSSVGVGAVFSVERSTAEVLAEIEAAGRSIGTATKQPPFRIDYRPARRPWRLAGRAATRVRWRRRGRGR